MNDLLETSVPQVSVDDLKKAIDANEQITIVDVRTPEEVVRGKIEGSINIPLDKIMSDVERVIPDKKGKIYVYCLSGSRSIHAVDAMINLGYTDVFDVSHGILAWRIGRYPLVT